MSVQTYWHTANRVIAVHFAGDLSETDIAQSRVDLVEFIRTGESRYIVVIDALGVTKLPSDFSSILNSMGKFQNVSQIVRTVIISANPVLNFFSLLSSKLFDVPIITFKTVEEAEVYIERYLPTLLETA